MSNRQVMLGILGAGLVVAGLSAHVAPGALGPVRPLGHAGQLRARLQREPAGAGRRPTAPTTPDSAASALLVRRLWAIPAAAVGWVVVMLTAAIWVRSAPDEPEESTRFWELRGDAT